MRAVTGDSLGGGEVEGGREHGQTAEHDLSRRRSAGRATTRRWRAGCGGVPGPGVSRRKAGGTVPRDGRRSRPEAWHAPGPQPVRWRGECRRGAGRSPPRRPRSPAVTANPSLTAAARSTNSRTAAVAATSSGVLSAVGTPRDWTRRTCSPSRPRGSRLVTTTCTSGRVAQHGVDELGHGAEHVLGVVEHHQHPPIDQVSHQGRRCPLPGPESPSPQR